MGFFDFLKPRSKENIESCWPGGKMLQVHIEYDTQESVFTYFGRYGLQFSVPKSNLTNVIVKEVSRTHSVLQLYSGEEHLTLNQGVQGSNPWWSTRVKNSHFV